MRLLDSNSIKNSRHGITDSKKAPYRNNSPPWSSFEEILPPFPVIKNADNFIITFDVNFKTQVLTKFRKSKRFEETHNLILTLHNKGLGNRKFQII
jgi:hypothetical protein